MEEQLKSALREKDILLKEIHHRVKNNLQIVSSLLMLQAEYTSDKKAVESLKDSTNRIGSIAFIHEHLYRSDDLNNGIGLSENLDFRNSSTLGLSLVSVLTQQLKGSIELDKTKGTKFKITFPI